MSKFAREVWFDADATRKRFVKLIFELRRAKKIDQWRAKELYDEANDYETQGMLDWAYRQDEFNDYDISEYGVFDYSPETKGFFKHIWPLFIEKLKAEF